MITQCPAVALCTMYSVALCTSNTLHIKLYNYALYSTANSTFQAEHINEENKWIRLLPKNWKSFDLA